MRMYSSGSCSHAVITIRLANVPELKAGSSEKYIHSEQNPQNQIFNHTLVCYPSQKCYFSRPIVIIINVGFMRKTIK